MYTISKQIFQRQYTILINTKCFVYAIKFIFEENSFFNITIFHRVYSKEAELLHVRLQLSFQFLTECLYICEIKSFHRKTQF